MSKLWCTVKVNSSCGIGCLSIIGVVILIGFFGSLLDNNDSTPNSKIPEKNWTEENSSTMANIMMEGFVKQRLKAPKSAEFPGVFDGRNDHVRRLGNQKYRIKSYVDAQNSFGATIRNNFIGVIEQTSEDRWRLISLDLYPR